MCVDLVLLELFCKHFKNRGGGIDRGSDWKQEDTILSPDRGPSLPHTGTILYIVYFGLQFQFNSNILISSTMISTEQHFQLLTSLVNTHTQHSLLGVKRKV